MGVVTDYMAPRQSRGTDWTCTFSVADHTHGRLGHLGEEGLKVRFFASPSDLPPIHGTGDVVVLRSVKISAWQGVVGAISSRASSWTVIHAPSIPEKAPVSRGLQLPHIKDSRAPVLSVPEMFYAIELCNQHDRNLFTSSAVVPSSSAISPSNNPMQVTTAAKDKFSLLKDLEVSTYRNLVAQIVKTYPHSDREEIYVTDYTTNKLLWNYNPEHEDLGREGDEFGYVPRSLGSNKWPGPWGKQTLTVALWSPHAQWARSNVKVGDFVRLQNVHIKWSRDSKLEGILHNDQRYPEKILVSLIKDHEGDDRVKDVLRRKRDYWKKYKQQNAEADDGERGKKRKNDDKEKPSNRKQARKKRKKDREETEVKAKTARSITNQTANTPNGATPTTTSNKDFNPNIRCSYHTTRPRTLASIKSLTKHTNTTPNGNTYTLPFNNINSRATVRIIDYFPRNLEDFAVRIPRRASEYAILSDAENATTSSSCASSTTSPSPFPTHDSDSGSDNRERRHQRRRWQWRFALILEDASPPPLPHKNHPAPQVERLEVLIAEQDAEYLLKLDACDLRRDAAALAALREKLFLLWGDLEERRAKQRVSSSPNGQGLEDGHGNFVPGPLKDGEGSRPFQCCLKEYGVKVRKSLSARATEGLEGTQNKVRQEGDIEVRDPESEGDEEWRWERRWRMWGCTII